MTVEHNTLGLVQLKKNGAKSNSGQLVLPSGLMKHLEAGMLFRPELTEDGILYRHVTESELDDAPAWTRHRRLRGGT